MNLSSPAPVFRLAPHELRTHVVATVCLPAISGAVRVAASPCRWCHLTVTRYRHLEISQSFKLLKELTWEPQPKVSQTMRCGP